MGIGLGIFLLVVGAVISFTRVDNQLTGSNLDVVGYILMAGGLLSLIFGTIQNRQRANTTHTAVVERRDVGVVPVERRVVEEPVERRVVEERRTDEPH